MTDHDLRDEPPVPLDALRADRLTRGAAPERWEALASRIERAAAPALARRADRRRAERATPLPILARALRPALVAAAAALVAVVGLAGEGSAAGGADALAAPLVSDTSVAVALGVDARGVSWVAQQRAPSDSDFVLALGLGEWE